MTTKAASKSKAKSKASQATPGKAKAKGKSMTAKERQAFKAADGIKAKGAGSKAKSGDGAALVSVGVKAGKGGKSVVTAEQLASMLGVTGKRLRGWLRDSAVLGNDGRYSHYAFDTASKDGKALIARAKARFKVAS